MDYNDVAVGPDGRIYLSAPSRRAVVRRRARAPAPTKGGVDVSAPRTRQECSTTARYPDGVDVDTDGTVYVINRVPSPGGAERQFGADPAAVGGWTIRLPILADPVAGCVVYAPDHAIRHGALHQRRRRRSGGRLRLAQRRLYAAEREPFTAARPARSTSPRWQRRVAPDCRT
jgi:sugar lactone lactonase YvrE